MVDPLHFDAQAAVYARARPQYPPALWERLRLRGLLEQGRQVLDLGAGTGQATGPLLAAGLEVTAVEPGPHLASELRNSYPAADLVTARAEDAELPTQSFDLAVAATSIHWMNLSVVVPKVHQLLRPHGTFAVWRNVFGDPEATATPFRDRVTQIVQARATPPRPGPDPEDVALTRDQLTSTGLFTAEETADFRWSIELDEGQIRRLFRTFSDWTPDEVDQAAAAVRDLGGEVVEHYRSWLIVLSRLDGSI